MNEEQQVMQLGVPYIVTTPGTNGDLEAGFHIMFNKNLSLFCMERGGYLEEKEQVDEAMQGVEVTPDLPGIHYLRLQHLEAIKSLTSFPEPTEEEWAAWQELAAQEAAAQEAAAQEAPAPEDVLLDMSVGTDVVN